MARPDTYPTPADATRIATYWLHHPAFPPSLARWQPRALCWETFVGIKLPEELPRWRVGPELIPPPEIMPKAPSDAW